MTTKYTAPIIIYVLALAQFAAPFMYAGVGIALPAMGRELHASGVQLGLIEMIYLGAASALLLPFGRYSDMTDRVVIFKIGLFIYSICTLVIGFLGSIELIIAARFIQGTSAALIMSTNMAILTNAVPKNKLGNAIGINIGAVYLGLSAGPFVAGWITAEFGWRWVFYGTFIPLVLAVILVQLFLKSNWKKPEVSFDWIGTAAIITAIFLLILGSTQLGKSLSGFIFSGLGVVVIILFFFIEKNISHPLINIDSIQSNTKLTIALVIQLLMYAGAFGISFLFSIYLQTVKGLNAHDAGLILVVSPVVMAFFAPICGRLADKYSPQLLASIGLFSSLIAAIGATQVAMESSTTFLIFILVFQGFGFAMFSSPNMAIIMNSVSPKEYGIASALSAKLRSLGMVLSMMIITVFMSLYLGSEMIDTHQNEFLSVMTFSFIIFALFAGTGTLLSLKKAAK